MSADGQESQKHCAGVRLRGPCEDGLWAATENSYDVIILDITLPKLNGYQVVEQMRRREVWTPVLMLTATDGEYDLADAFDLGADDYLNQAVLVRGAGGPTACPDPSWRPGATGGAEGR